MVLSRGSHPRSRAQRAGGARRRRIDVIGQASFHSAERTASIYPSGSDLAGCLPVGKSQATLRSHVRGGGGSMGRRWNGRGASLLTVAGAVVVALSAAPPLAAAVPANDALAGAVTLAAAGGSLTTTNLEATKEAGEPEHAGNPGGASIWFKWTPNFTGMASIDASGSAVDTLLAGYTGASIAGLSLVASDDDVSDAASSGRVCFPVTAGATWRIAVDGYAGAAGDITLHWGAKADVAPCPTLPPTITGPGAPTVGDTLTATAGSFADAGATVARQWLRCQGGFCEAIATATGATYQLQERDQGEAIRVDVTSSDGVTAARNAAPPTAVVAGHPTLAENGRLFWSDGDN